MLRYLNKVLPNRAVEPPSYVTEEVPFDDSGSFDDFDSEIPF